MSEVVSDPLIDAALGAPAEPAEPAWVGPSQEEWEQTQQALYYMQQAQQAPPEPSAEQQAQYPQIDPFADNYSEQLGGFLSQVVQQQLAPLFEWQYGQQLGEAEERALDILDDIVSRDGEFIEQDKAYEAARALANVFMPEESQRYGYGPKAAEAALQRAAGVMREYEKAVGNAYVERHMNQLTNLSGARREPGAGSIGAQQLVTEPGGDELSLVRKYGGFPGSH